MLSIRTASDFVVSAPAVGHSVAPLPDVEAASVAALELVAPAVVLAAVFLVRTVRAVVNVVAQLRARYAGRFVPAEELVVPAGNF